MLVNETCIFFINESR